MKNYITPKNFKSDVQSLLNFAEKKGLHFHGIIFNDENIATVAPLDDDDEIAKLTAIAIKFFAERLNTDLDLFIDDILATIAKLRDKNV